VVRVGVGRGVNPRRAALRSPSSRVTPKIRGSRAQRVVDVLVSVSVILVTLPIVALAALFLRLTLRRPAVVREQRVGRWGRPFLLLRLSTSTGEPSSQGSTDSRIGERMERLFERLGIAGLPEFFNVLRGQMSVVGPRPWMVTELARYTPSEGQLLEVRPGLVSPAWRARRPDSDGIFSGVEFEHEASVAGDRFIELRYIQRRTTATDAWILLRALMGLCVRLLASSAIFVVRVTPWLLVDSLIVGASMSLAYYLRFLDQPIPAGTSTVVLVWTVAFMSVGYALMNLCFLLHRRAWRYASGVEVFPIALSTVTSATIATVVDVLHPGTATRVLPLGVMVFGTVLSGAGFVLFRYRSRIGAALARPVSPSPKAGPQQTRAVVYGAGELGQLLVRRIRSHIDGRGYKIVGFFDDDPRKQRLTVHGIRVVGGREALTSFVAQERIDVIVLAMGTASGADMRHILSLAQGTSAQIKVAHDLVNWMSDRYSTSLLRDIRPEDLIGRRPASLDEARCHELVSGRTILVTGACGSIGSEVIRQILTLRPARIVAVDINESGLYDLAVETKARTAETDLQVVVADVTNRHRMLEVVGAERPQVIFHVAAYKHVPLMELYPHEAAWTNVWGTWVMVDVAQQCQAGHLVLVSTDKAVNPSSVMGATKRIAEILVPGLREAPRDNEGVSGVRVTVVRFGNVLGSRGSVIPTFSRQIELGAAVTVTHPDMTRYFMHPEEAAALIVEAAGLSQTGGVFMLDMGDRVRIDELARKMIRMRGLRPNVDVPIEYTGLRPGEKLHEELIYAHEARLETAHPRIFQIQSQETSLVLRNRILRIVHGFASGRVERHAFTTELVAVAAELVGAPLSGGATASNTDKSLVGRRHSPASEGSAGQVNVPHPEAARNTAKRRAASRIGHPAGVSTPSAVHEPGTATAGE
jgi:FlaA1/EpsC-like NDP-sugar epimerase/lipopolysaccharide/colanic/teichoic acid biosynthesis glycosyltransferase